MKESSLPLSVVSGSLSLDLPNMPGKHMREMSKEIIRAVERERQAALQTIRRREEFENVVSIEVQRHSRKESRVSLLGSRSGNVDEQFTSS
ncbi:hypothetical protein [Paludifilum halophilum]|uniref:hypothetical protein n=1 Tax=Paludifilum halophilum TaxID=1642702 RepID=UPI00146EC160|nr:hypothetical protein [Paludifilum halophilum]